MRNPWTWGAAGGGVILILLIALLSGRDLPPPWMGKPAPAWRAKDVDDRWIDSRDYRGEVLLVNFWMTRARGSWDEQATLNSLASSYREKGLAVVGFSLDPGGEWAVRMYRRDQPFEYPLVVPDPGIRRSYERIVGPIEAIPTTILVDRRGFVRELLRGAQTMEDLDARVKPLLAEPGP